MYEVEIKVPAEADAVRERLREAGAERVDARRQRDAYYDAPHRDFAETDEALRIRRESPLPAEAPPDSPNDGRSDEASTAETTKVTYKGPLLDEGSKTRVEHETAVDDGEAMAGVLSGLGFEPAAVVEKRREFWSFAGFTVTLDAVDGVGEFVEIEREVDDEGAIEATRDEAMEALDRLGLDGDSQVRTSYLGLLLAGDDGGN
ncbi:class IV adenylate cyclase [Halorubrum lipolyticum]|uniref:Adenylyl cyclase CyaB n=1 Tax=Halorubrum lipolyticum DSM 21995 TaxID=1227482 RepID=M0P083_9EURY|nr:class IV adenylate cyclase [Halorubrum lipolyticum]EMA62934.1 adenylyl cyclase CyaB [Halorubrum lipolyticum DSM 21995]